MPEVFPLMNIGDMDLDKRDCHTRQRISQCDAGMCIRASIDNDGSDFVGSSLMDAIYERAFVVGLEARDGNWFDGCGEFCAAVSEHRLYVGQRLTAIYVGLSGTQEVEIGAIQEED